MGHAPRFGADAVLRVRPPGVTVLFAPQERGRPPPREAGVRVALSEAKELCADVLLALVREPLRLGPPDALAAVLCGAVIEVGAIRPL